VGYHLVTGPLAEQLPLLRRLAGPDGPLPLASTLPPTTIPAWPSMFTGRDPGQLGIYGFRHRYGRGYDDFQPYDSTLVTAPFCWERLSERGHAVVVIGVPGTWPPRPLHGALVSGFPVPRPAGVYCWPPYLAEEIGRDFPGYRTDISGYRGDDPEVLLERIRAMVGARLQLARRWLRRRDWELFVLAEIGTDRLHHALWHTWSPEHPRYRPGAGLAGAIPAFYRWLNDELSELVEAAGPETAVLLVSDHGTQTMRGGFRINRWLLENGYLYLRGSPPPGQPLQARHVDWSRTRAWARGGYAARIYLNIRGREPRGIVAAEQAAGLVEELAMALARLDAPPGPIDCLPHLPGKSWRACAGLPADLLLEIGGWAWRALGSLGTGKELFSAENDTGPDSANHHPLGILAGGPAAGLPPAAEGDIPLTRVNDLILDFFTA